jgi:hypothetical protein
MNSARFLCLAAALVAGFVAAASADEPSNGIAPSSLAGMGLGGMRMMSDDEGTAVRGMGTFVDGNFKDHKMSFPFDHKKFDHRNGFDHKKFVHGRGFDHKRFDHKKFDHGKNFGHKTFGHGKNFFGHKMLGHGMDKSFGGHKFGGGMIWASGQMSPRR